MLRTYAVGPRPGVTAMVTMLSYNGTCFVSVNVDPEVVTDADVIQTYLPLSLLPGS